LIIPTFGNSFSSSVSRKSFKRNNLEVDSGEGGVAWLSSLFVVRRTRVQITAFSLFLKKFLRKTKNQKPKVCNPNFNNIGGIRLS